MPSEQAITAKLNALTPPKTNAYKPKRESWVRMKQANGRTVYRHSGEILVKLAPSAETAALFAADGDVKAHATRIDTVTPDVQHIAFDEHSITLDAFMSKLRSKPGVQHVEPNVIAHVQAAQTAAAVPNFQNKLWHLNKAPERRAFIAKKRGAIPGAAVTTQPHAQTTVCTIDTGIDLDHEDLKANIVPGINVISSPLLGEPTDTEMDYNGHGTMVAGIIGALDNDMGVEGVNPNVSLCAIKAFDKEGSGRLSDILAGIEWAVAHHVDILNLSFGSYEYSALLEEAIQKARANGMVVIAAAGNDYANDTMYPAKYNGVVAVGSHDEGGWISRHSNWGADVSVFAPGNSMLSTSLSEYGDDRYAPFFGTSAATAYVAGLASLLRGEGYSASQVESALKDTVYLAASENNPSRAAFKILNMQAIFADLEHRPLEALALSKFFVGQRIVPTTGTLEIDVAIQNIGTRVAKGAAIKLKVLSAAGEQLLTLGNVPTLRRGGTIERHYSVPATQLMPGLNRATDTITAVSITPVIEFALNPQDTNPQQIFITDKQVPALRVRALWVSPLDFLDADTNRTVYAMVENTGNTPQSDLSVRVSSIPALHEGVPQSPRTPIGSPQSLASLAPGEVRLVAIPINDFVPPPQHVTFALEILRGAQVAKLHLQGYRYSDERGLVTPQYAQTVHRNIVDQAIRLLEKQGIYIPDLQNPVYRGSPSSANEWPEIAGLPTAKISVNGYWNDDILNGFSTDFSGLNFSMIDGSHDADGVDIAFGYSFEDNFDSHFWIVDRYDDDGLNSNGSNHHSALTKLRALLNGGGQLDYGAIAHYKAGYKKAAWWFLGHAAHLMGDISVPSHVNNENMHGVYGATYHGWMDKGSYAKWSYLDAEQKGGFINVNKEPAEGDPLRFLAYTTAQVGNSFPWAETIGTSDGHAGNRAAGGDVPHYDNYMNTVYSGMAPRPLARWHVNKDEVNDTCAFDGCLCCNKCQLVDWVGTNEQRRDCEDHDGHIDYDNSDNNGNDSDGDMTRIAQTNYPYAIRATAGLIYWFAVETGQIARVEVRNALPAILNLILN